MFNEHMSPPPIDIPLRAVETRHKEHYRTAQVRVLGQIGLPAAPGKWEESVIINATRIYEFLEALIADEGTDAHAFAQREKDRREAERQRQEAEDARQRAEAEEAAKRARAEERQREVEALERELAAARAAAQAEPVET